MFRQSSRCLLILLLVSAFLSCTEEESDTSAVGGETGNTHADQGELDANDDLISDQAPDDGECGEWDEVSAPDLDCPCEFGQSWAMDDDCNYCDCWEGAWVCTEMFCGDVNMPDLSFSDLTGFDMGNMDRGRLDIATDLWSSDAGDDVVADTAVAVDQREDFRDLGEGDSNPGDLSGSTDTSDDSSTLDLTVDAAPEISPECVLDTDCAEGEVCTDGACELAPPECVLDTDCAEGEVCTDGACVTST
jgi:Cys-rich repeat protein